MEHGMVSASGRAGSSRLLSGRLASNKIPVLHVAHGSRRSYGFAGGVRR